MTTANLLSDLQDQGVVLFVEDGTLKIKAKKGIVQPDQVKQLKANKAEIINIIEAKNKPTKALSYGCAGCGNRVYLAVIVWGISELPTTSPWTHEHTPITHWKCKGCGAVFSIIGGSKGPQHIN